MILLQNRTANLLVYLAIFCCAVYGKSFSAIKMDSGIRKKDFLTEKRNTLELHRRRRYLQVCYFGEWSMSMPDQRLLRSLLLDEQFTRKLLENMMKLARTTNDRRMLEMLYEFESENFNTTSFINRKFRKKRYAMVDLKWTKTNVTYTIKNFTPKIGKEGTHRAIEKAFAVWAKHVPLNFVEVSEHENPDIVVVFVEDYRGDDAVFNGEDAGNMAFAYYPGPGKGGDMHFDYNEAWTIDEGPNEGYDLFLVAVHLVGHALGLRHSTDINAVMSPIYLHHDTSDFQLTQDDIDGIQHIYGKPDLPGITNVSDVCDIDNFDAISVIHDELYVFSSQYVWRKYETEAKARGPYPIRNYWPEVGSGVDAVFENPSEGTTIILKGSDYYKYRGTGLMPRYPKSIRSTGINKENFDAAIWWHRNRKAYLFKGGSYWRLRNDRVNIGYPKDMDAWIGIPDNLDAAFIGFGEDGANHTYFVKGNKYWKFHAREVRLFGEHDNFKQDWLGC